MEITVQNYRQLRNSFDTTKLNAAVLEVFNDVDADFEDYLELYTDASPENDGIRDVVNNHIKLVNKYFVDQPKATPTENLKKAVEKDFGKSDKIVFVDARKEDIENGSILKSETVNGTKIEIISKGSKYQFVIDGKGRDIGTYDEMNKKYSDHKNILEANSKAPAKTEPLVIYKEGKYITRKTIQSDYSFTDNENLAYTWTESERSPLEKTAKIYDGLVITMSEAKKLTELMIASKANREKNYPAKTKKETQPQPKFNVGDIVYYKQVGMIDKIKSKKLASGFDDDEDGSVKWFYELPKYGDIMAAEEMLQLATQPQIDSLKTTKAKATPKTKVAKVIDKTIVDNFSPEFLLIRRFWNIIKTETVHVPFRTVQLLYMAFNKAAVERKVRKVSEAAELFTACNKKIITLFEDIPNESKKPYEIEFTDKKLYNQIKEYVTDVAVNPAVPLLKRFIAMQNTSADKTKAKTLQKSIVKLMGTDNFENNRLFKEIQTAEFELNDYILNDSKLEPTIYGLSVPRVCKNRVKCSGLTANGQLKKGYKFREDTNEVIRVTKAPSTRKPAAKKATVKKKVVVGLGFSDDVERIYANNQLIPITGQLEFQQPEAPTPVQEKISQPAPDQVQPPVVKNKLMNMQFDSLNMDEGWENFMQNPAKNMKMAIWGAPKNGKTAGSLQLANYLSKFGKVLYNFADQGFNKSTQDLWQMSGLANNPKAEPSDVQTLDDLEKEIATGKYAFVFIDMISDYINKEGIKPYEFKERFMKKYPKVSFILVFEVTKGGNFKGDQGWTHIVDAIVTVEDFLMENRGRYGVGSHIVWEDGLKRFNPKRYEEVIEELNPGQLEFNEVEKI